VQKTRVWQNEYLKSSRTTLYFQFRLFIGLW
jgi:hypothetical protein